MLRIYTILYFLFLATTLPAQTAETITVHFDKPFYAAGENIWYKIYVGLPVEEIQSKVVRIELIDPNGIKVVQQKLQIKENYATGDIVLPYNWKEGQYLFRAYTLWSLNFGNTTIFEKEIPIYNLLEATKTLALDEIVKATASQPQKKINSSYQITTQLNQPAYTKNEKVKVLVEVKDSNGKPVPIHLSISVTDGNYLPTQSSSLLVFSNKGKMKPQLPFKAEKYLQLRATILDKGNEPVTTQFLSLYFPKLGIFQSTKIKEGKMQLSIPDFNQEQVVQIFDMNPFHEPIPKVIIDEPSPPLAYKGKQLKRDTLVGNYLYLLSLYRQYQEVFRIPTPVYSSIPLVERKQWQPDEHYEMEDYSSLPDVIEFAKEALIKARMITKKETATLRLSYDDNKVLHKNPPWYIYNNWLTQESMEILKTPLRTIETIDIFNNSQSISQQLDPALVRAGVFAIYTKDGKIPKAITAQRNNKSIVGYYFPRTFTTPIVEEEYPYFPPLIYWNGSISANDGQVTIQFVTSSSVGTHQINVVCGLKNGEVVTKTITYRVTN